jgi:hypothetical protein
VSEVQPVIANSKTKNITNNLFIIHLPETCYFIITGEINSPVLLI